MTKEFEVEKYGIKIKLEFRNPTRLDRRDWLASSSTAAKEYEKFKGKENEHVDEGLELAEKLEVKRLENVFNLLITKDQIKSSADFDTLAYSDIEKITGWFEESIGIKRGGDATNFSKT